VGDLRWRAPQPVKPWTGVRDATKQGAVCPEGGQARPGVTISEDCLFVNVWTGAKAAGEKRAVMVWIHGGGQTTADHWFDGEALAKKGVVVVTVEYRVGALGALATPELSKESGHGASGNWGLMDDIAALKWIQKNITAFGGDPKNVTLFGHSYGAGSQHFLAMSPLAKGLFERMSTESHARYPKDPVLFQVATAYTTLAAAEAAGGQYMSRLGAKSLAEARAMPLDKITSTQGGGGGGHVLDGYVLPHDYTETYARGDQADVNAIAGFNKDETGSSPSTAFDVLSTRTRGGGPGGGGNGVPAVVTKIADYHTYAQRMFGPMADEFLKLYPATTDREAFEAHNDATRDNGRVSLWMWAQSWRQKADKPVYLYFWTHAPPGPGHDVQGAYHGSEIEYLFDHSRTTDETWTADDQRIGGMMSAYWSNYAKTGDPNGPGLPKWAPWDGKTEQVMELGDHFGPIPLADKAKVDFWKRFYETQPAR
jgi:carboxylesterase type B